jgi:hypothetical protein
MLFSASNIFEYFQTFLYNFCTFPYDFRTFLYGFRTFSNIFERFHLNPCRWCFSTHFTKKFFRVFRKFSLSILPKPPILTRMSSPSAAAWPRAGDSLSLSKTRIFYSFSIWQLRFYILTLVRGKYEWPMGEAADNFFRGEDLWEVGEENLYSYW